MSSALNLRDDKVTLSRISRHLIDGMLFALYNAKPTKMKC